MEVIQSVVQSIINAWLVGVCTMFFVIAGLVGVWLIAKVASPSPTGHHKKI